jgi:hypothetical protein
LLQKAGNLKLAATMLRRATEEDPVSRQAWTMRRDTLVQLGRTRMALMAAHTRPPKISLRWRGRPKPANARIGRASNLT